MNDKTAFAFSSLAGFMIGALSAGNAMGGVIEVFHADSLAAPLGALKKTFEAKNSGVTINLTGGTSRQLADRILQGEPCDLFAPSSAPIADELVSKNAAAWSVVFSANEMVVITAKHNPHGVKQISDLAKPEVNLVRINGEKDLGTRRTIEFVKRAANLEGKPEIAQQIIDRAATANSVPDTMRAVHDGKANAGIVYYSAAIAAKNDVEIVRFPASVNLSEAIQNAAAVPRAAKNEQEAVDFVRFILSPEGREILVQTGQPPVVPPIRKGQIPAELAN